MPELIRADITIIGAGPSGATAAISLANKGIPVLLIDRHQFPRPKICGDGLSGKVVTNLNRLDSAYVDDLRNAGIATASLAARFSSPNRKMMELSFQTDDPTTPPGFICRRADFDHFLLNKALAFKDTTFLGGVQVNGMDRKEDCIRIFGSGGTLEIESRLVLFAAGADRRLIRKLDPSFPDPTEEGIGVRAYYDRVTGSDYQHAIEIHFLKELLPWYFWIFPFDDGSANVGLALPESIAKRKSMSLKELMFHLIRSYPDLKERFPAEITAVKTEAARLAYFNGPCPVAGDRYLLLGDAARLIDPFTGEGIGNAMVSGRYAAEIASACIAKGDFSGNITQEYQSLIDSRLGPELNLGLRLQSLAQRQYLLNLVIGRAARSETTRQLISEMLYNQNARMKLSKPEFYIKILLGR